MATKRKAAAAQVGSEAQVATRSGRMVKRVDYSDAKDTPVVHAAVSQGSHASQFKGKVEIFKEKAALPERSKDGKLHFQDFPNFTPLFTPAEIMQQGAFGGTYFRPIKSGVTGDAYKDAHKEFPAEWWKGLAESRHLTSSVYDASVNKYQVACGGSLDMWESSGWIAPADPYGWYQWYCRFFLGRRSSDDARQVARWSRVCGPTGRFRIQLINKIYRAGGVQHLNNRDVSPVIRQSLLHWGYEVTARDYTNRIKAKKRI